MLCGCFAVIISIYNCEHEINGEIEIIILQSDTLIKCNFMISAIVLIASKISVKDNVRDIKILTF